MSIRIVLPVLLLMVCAACGGKEAQDPAKAQAEAHVADYLKPPTVLTARPGSGGAFRIEGVAQPNAVVRLIQADESTLTTTADAQGHWALSVPASPVVRLFAPTMTSGGRTVGGEGFLMLAPDGRAAQLRAASASQVLVRPAERPKILAVDFDRDGGAIIGGVAPAGTGMNIRVDRVASGDVIADAQGRFVAAIRQQIGPGPHLIDISGDAGEDQIVINAGRAAPLDAAPFRAERLDKAWRIDWMTPGGGMQSSIIVARSEAGA